MTDETRGAILRSLSQIDSFQAQVELEETTYNSLLQKLASLSLNETTLALEYAKIRGALDAIKMIQSSRERLIEQARSRSNS
jgi:hypothetical protein